MYKFISDLVNESFRFDEFKIPLERLHKLIIPVFDVNVHILVCHLHENSIIRFLWANIDTKVYF